MSHGELKHDTIWLETKNYIRIFMVLYIHAEEAVLMLFAFVLVSIHSYYCHACLGVEIMFEYS